jgi:hypothetical protein
MLNLEETLKSELPQARYLVLELAALLDRLDEAAQRDHRSLDADVPMRSLRAALVTLCTPAGPTGRAEQVLLACSDTDAAIP